MANKTRAELITSLNNNVLTGGRRTTAQKVRDYENDIIESLLNKQDDSDVAGGYLAIGTNGIVDISFIKKTTPTGQFLRDDGTWQTVSGGGSQTLAQTLTLGAKTGGYTITSDNEFSTLDVADGGFDAQFNDGTNIGRFYTSATRALHRYTDGTDIGVLDITATKNELSHTQLNEYNAPLHRFLGGDIKMSGSIVSDNGNNSFTVNDSAIGASFGNVESGSSLINDTSHKLQHSLLLEIISPQINITGSYTGTSSNGFFFSYLDNSIGGFNYVNGGSDIGAGISSSEAYLYTDGGEIKSHASQNTFDHNILNQFIAPINLFSSGGISFVSGIGIDTTATGGSDVLNIGATNANVINYGNSSTIHNFLGTAIYELQVNSYVTDKLMTLNYGGAAASGIGVGFEINENNVITGYLKTNAARNGFSVLTPAIAYKADLNLNLLTADRAFSLPDVAGTLAVQGYVTGTTNRITVTSGVVDISATFEALLGKVANPLSQFASTTSAQLAGVISDETGSGSLVFGTSPTLVTPTLGVATATSLDVSGTAGAGYLGMLEQSSSPAAVSNKILMFPNSSNQLRTVHENGQEMGFSRTLYKNFTDSSSLTGSTSNTLVDSVLVKGNTFLPGDGGEVTITTRKTGTAGNVTNRIYFNTSSSLSGATLIRVNVIASSNLHGSLAANFRVKSATNTEVLNTAVTATTNDEGFVTSAAALQINYDWTVDNYIISANQNGNSGDTTNQSTILITKF